MKLFSPATEPNDVPPLSMPAPTSRFAASPRRPLAPPPSRLKHFFGGARAVIESFFEQRNSAQIRVSEMNSAIRFRRRPSSLAPNKAGPRSDHRVSPSHHVNAFRQRTNLRVSTRQIGQRYIGPFIAA